jgi:Sulfotransferase family
MSESPYLFVVGCPRSGTTLLQRMLDNHPLLAVANDTHFIPRAPSLAEGLDPPLTPELVEWVLGSQRFYRLGLPEELVRKAAAHARTYGEFVSALYSELGKLRGKPLAGEKTPDYVQKLPLLHALFPWVKTIHIIRDGRDVALSTMRWAHEDRGPGRYRLWQEEPLAVCALWWRLQVSTGRTDAERLSPTRYFEVRYEDLVIRPDDTLQELTAFLELPFAPEMLAYYVGKLRPEPGLSAKKAWLPPTPRLRDWRAHMSPRDVQLFEALAGDLLSELGYKRVFDNISPEIATLSERYRNLWESERAQRPAKRARKRLGAADPSSEG